MSFDLEKNKFASEVDLEAADLVRKGIVAPHEAIGIARESVLSKRRVKYNQSLDMTQKAEHVADIADGEELCHCRENFSLTRLRCNICMKPIYPRRR